MKIKTLLFARLMFATLSTVAVIAFLIVSWYNDSRDKAIATVGTLAAAVAEGTGQHVQDVQNVLKSIRRRPGVVAMDPNACNEGFEYNLSSDPSYATISLVDKSGQTICAVAENGNGTKPNFADRDWFQETIRTDGFVAMGPYSGRLTGVNVVVMANPIHDINEAIVGVVVLSVPTTKFHPIFNLDAAPPDVTVSIVNRRGTVVHTDSRTHHGAGNDLGPVIMRRVLQTTSGTGVNRDGGGTELVFGFWTIPASELVAVVSQPIATVLAQTQTQSVRAGVTAVVIIALVFLFAAMTSRHLSAQIEQISGAARRVADGNFDVRMPVPSISDFATVARQFNRMLDTHEESERRIRKLNLLYAALSETSQVITKVGDRRHMTEAVCRILTERCGFALAWVGFVDPASSTMTPSAFYGTAGQNIAESIARIDPNGEGPVGYALRLNRPQVIADLSNDPRSAHWYKGATDLRMNSTAIFALTKDGVPNGVIAIFYREKDFFSDPELMSVIGETANALSFGLESLERNAARLETDARFRQIAETIHEVFWLTDPAKNRILYTSPAYEAIWGRSVQELYGSPRLWIEAIHVDDRARILDAATTKQVLGTYDEEYRIVRPDGAIRWIHDRAFPIRDAHGNVFRIAGIAEDITQRKAFEEALRSSEAILEAAQELAGLGSWERRGLTNEVIWSDTMYKLLYRDPALGPPTFDQLLDLIDPADRSRLMARQAQAYSSDRQISVEYRTNPLNGPVRQMRSTVAPIKDDNGAVIGHRGIVYDITKIREAEAKLFQAQKMEALGNLAGGIAHDFNNMLLPIINLTAISSDELPADHPIQENLSLVLEAAERAGRLVKQILAFSRRGHHNLQTLDVTGCIDDALRLLRNALPATIKLTTDIAPQIGIIEADPDELNSVILNMGTNAAHAMRNSGHLRIAMSRARLDSDQCLTHPELSLDRWYVKIEIADTGRGMDPETMAKIFNPFFTTKPVGEGTGLGLAMVHGIVESLHGLIEVSSELNVGTTFTIYLPLVEGETIAA